MLRKRLFASILVVVIAATFIPHTTVTAATPMGVTAQAAIVIDFETGEVLYERSAHTRRVPASMTKSMTAFITYEEIAADNLTLDTRIRVSANAARMSENNPGSRLLATGSYYTVNELLLLAMLPSSNRACIVLAEHISGTEEAFVTRMNETAAEMGIYTAFTNSHGAHDHYTTAYAMGRLVYEFIHRHPDILRITNTGNAVIGGQNQSNTNRLIHNRQLAGLDGFKTGTLPRAGFNLQATAIRGGRRIITVVMNSPNNDRRFADTRILMDFGFAEAARRDAARMDDAARMVFVQLNGELMTFDVPARVDNGRTLVPMRPIFEAFGAIVHWDASSQTITATKDDTVILMPLGSYTPTVNGQIITIDAPGTAIDGRTLVPLRFVAEALNIPVVWESETRTVIINTAEEQHGDDENEMSEAEALATLLILARSGMIDENFAFILTSIVNLVNFYMNVNEPAIVEENMQAYAITIAVATRDRDSELYAFWNALGDDGALIGPNGVEPSGGEWPEWEQVVAAGVELRGIIARINENSGENNESRW